MTSRRSPSLYTYSYQQTHTHTLLPFLDNDCTYNDGYGENYLGSKAVTEEQYTCQPWSEQTAYDDDSLADGSRALAGSYCRNPDPHDYRTWCYYHHSPDPNERRHGYCSLSSCGGCALMY